MGEGNSGAPEVPQKVCHRTLSGPVQDRSMCIGAACMVWIEVNQQVGGLARKAHMCGDVLDIQSRSTIAQAMQMRAAQGAQHVIPIDPRRLHA